MLTTFLRGLLQFVFEVSLISLAILAALKIYNYPAGLLKNRTFTRTEAVIMAAVMGFMLLVLDHIPPIAFHLF